MSSSDHGRAFQSLRASIYAGDRNVSPVDHRIPEGLPHRHFVLGSDPPLACLTPFVWGRALGGLALFEAEKGASTELLFQEAENWLQENGCKEVWGPIDFSIWRRYRLMTEGFEKPSFLGEPYNPPHYPGLFEKAGYRVVQEWSTTEGIWEDYPKALAFLKPYHDKATGLGYRFLSSTAASLRSDLERVFPILNASFSSFVGYTPLKEEDFWAIAASLVPLADPETVILVEDPEGEAVAFQITLPDPNGDLPRERYIQQYVGRSDKKSRVALGRAALYATLSILHRRGIPVDMLAPLMSRGNHSRAMASGLTRPLKTYALYGKNLD